jgi:hypothetical protein
MKREKEEEEISTPFSPVLRPPLAAIVTKTLPITLYIVHYYLCGVQLRL